MEGPEGLGGSSRVLEGPVRSWRVLEGLEGLGGSSRVLESLGGSGRVLEGLGGSSSAHAGIGLLFYSLSRPTFPFTPFNPTGNS